MKVKNQHYVSQGLIRFFSENKKMVYEFNLEHDRIYQTGISSTMSGKYTYEHPLLPDNKLENEFKRIEDVYIPIIRQIIDLLDNNEIEKAKIIIYKILESSLMFYYRSGTVLAEFSFHVDFDNEYAIESMLKRITNQNYIKNLANTLRKQYEFLIIKSNENNFILSDQYISTASLDCKGKIINISNRTIGLKNTLVMIPLSSKYYIVFFDGDLKIESLLYKDKINTLENNGLLAFNKVILRNSSKSCVAMHKNVLEMMKKYKATTSFPQAIVKYNNGRYGSFSLKREVFFYDFDYDMFDNFIKYLNEINQVEKNLGRKLGRNDYCFCGSGKKLKKCCIEKYNRAKLIEKGIRENSTRWFHNGNSTVEVPVSQFWGLKENLPKQQQMLIDQTERIREKTIRDKNHHS